MAICNSCGGLLGRDCFNPIECTQITNSMNQHEGNQIYLDALVEAKKTIEWMSENMQLINPELTEASVSLIDNTIEQITKILPTDDADTGFDWDNLPF